MNKEDYVSLEVAKLLKEKGFDEPYFYFYHNGKLYTLNGDIICSECDNIHDGIIYPVSTLYEATEWLREKYMIYISSLPTKDNGITVWYFQIVKDTFEDAIYSRVYPNTFNTYEEALNEGILEALKSI